MQGGKSAPINTSANSLCHRGRFKKERMERNKLWSAISIARNVASLWCFKKITNWKASRCVYKNSIWINNSISSNPLPASSKPGFTIELSKHLMVSSILHRLTGKSQGHSSKLKPSSQQILKLLVWNFKMLPFIFVACKVQLKKKRHCPELQSLATSQAIELWNVAANIPTRVIEVSVGEPIYYYLPW